MFSYFLRGEQEIINVINNSEIIFFLKNLLKDEYVDTFVIGKPVQKNNNPSKIEDDILITEEGPINLSKHAPRSWKKIEDLMAQKSALDDFILPTLEID